LFKKLHPKKLLRFSEKLLYGPSSTVDGRAVPDYQELALDPAQEVLEQTHHVFFCVEGALLLHHVEPALKKGDAAGITEKRCDRGRVARAGWASGPPERRRCAAPPSAKARSPTDPPTENAPLPSFLWPYFQMRPERSSSSAPYSLLLPLARIRRSGFCKERSLRAWPEQTAHVRRVVSETSNSRQITSATLAHTSIRLLENRVPVLLVPEVRAISLSVLFAQARWRTRRRRLVLEALHTLLLCSLHIHWLNRTFGDDAPGLGSISLCFPALCFLSL
jgi:hypothetical protein